MRLKCSQSRDKDWVPSSPGLTDAFTCCSEDPESLTAFVAQWWQEGGEIVQAAMWEEHKLKHGTEEGLEPVPHTFWAYAVLGVTCEKGRWYLLLLFIIICIFIIPAVGHPLAVPLWPSVPSIPDRLQTCPRVEVGWKLEHCPNSLGSLYMLQPDKLLWSWD